ncbi:uncharacterized protein LOC112906000 [Agrilus planipennis]|nr:uncharacterized protein LOC112906000 [Agrilus planipennis]
MCKPNSQFRIDCDICQCSSDGTEYSCSNRNCDDDDTSDVDVFNFKGRLRNPRIPIPYFRENDIRNSAESVDDIDLRYDDDDDHSLNINDDVPPKDDDFLINDEEIR